MACKKTKASEKKPAPVKHIGIVKNDPWLEPFEGAICGRHDHALYKLNQLTDNGKQTLSDFASGYLYFGLHKTAKGWVLREWAPNATDIYLVGDFNGWNEKDDAQQMTWDAANVCFTITGAGVTTNGWKFTANNSWGINLGGDTLNDLVANGPNISVAGSTIKLYPCRTTSDKIYCTVK